MRLTPKSVAPSACNTMFEPNGEASNGADAGTEPRAALSNPTRSRGSSRSDTAPEPTDVARSEKSESMVDTEVEPASDLLCVDRVDILQFDTLSHSH